MTLDEKRRTVEALLCAGGDANNVSLTYAIGHVGCDYYKVLDAVDASCAGDPSGPQRYGDRLTEVAYFLIESSPKLRSEWFGTP
jgi:hypothetical protein